jgi:tetratricopeptide (TPR) repeat protein
MKSTFVLIGMMAAFAVAGCKPKPEDITPLQRKEAASLVSEAQFAMTLRDYARAEPLFEKAAKLCPDDGGYWLGLGVTRRRMGNQAGAKAAYEKARSAYQDSFERDTKDSDALLQEVYVLALLGRVDDANKVMEKARKKDPENPRFRSFSENKQMDRLLVEPSFKEIAL